MTTTEQEIRSAYARMRRIDSTIPDNVLDFMKDAALQALAAPKWISVTDRPLFTDQDNGRWIVTKDGEGEFLAAVPYNDKRQPGKLLWWVRHCVIEDDCGLCVVGDDFNEVAGWQLSDVTFWMKFPDPPQ